MLGLLSVGCLDPNPDFDGPAGASGSEGVDGTTDTAETGTETGTGSGTETGTGSGTSSETGTDTTDDTQGCVPQGAEVCNGADDDCDGKVDEWSEDNQELCDGCLAKERSGTAYYFCRVAIDWNSAQAACQKRGANLASSLDAGENDFIRIGLDDVGAGESWIGLNDTAQEGSFEWVGGGPVGAYQPWKSGQPDDDMGEDCVEIELDGDWNDLDCSLDRAGFACSDANP